MKEKIAIGKVLKPHGVDGNFLVQIYSGRLEGNTYPNFYIQERGEYRELMLSDILEYRPAKGVFLARVVEKDSISPFSLYQTELFVDELPYDLLQEGEFFFHDLQGATVLSNENIIGAIVGVHDIASRTVVEVELPEAPLEDGHSKAPKRPKTVLLPMWEPFLLKIDMEKKSVVFGEIHDFL